MDGGKQTGGEIYGRANGKKKGWGYREVLYLGTKEGERHEGVEAK